MTMLVDNRRRLDALVARTQRLLGDFSGERYLPSRIVEALNAACLDLALTTELIRDEINVRSKANQWYYDAAEQAAEDATKHGFGHVVRVGYNGGDEVALLPTTTLIQDFADPLASASTGTPTNFRLEWLSYGQFAVSPIPAEDGEALPSEVGNLQITYIGMPGQMSGLATDYPDSHIPSYYHDLLPYFAAAWLLYEGELEDLQVADRFMARWAQGTREVVSDTYHLTTYNDMVPL